MLHRLGLTFPHPKLKSRLRPIKTPNQNLKVSAEQSKGVLDHLTCLLDSSLPPIHLHSNQPTGVSTAKGGTQSSHPKSLPAHYLVLLLFPSTWHPPPASPLTLVSSGFIYVPPAAWYPLPGISPLTQDSAHAPGSKLTRGR